MPWFRCLLNGENFPGVLIDRDVPVGFYVTRYVQAGHAAEAERIAVQRVLDEEPISALRQSVDCSVAKILADEVELFREECLPEQESGFIFYAMES